MKKGDLVFMTKDRIEPCTGKVVVPAGKVIKLATSEPDRDGDILAYKNIKGEKYNNMIYIPLKHFRKATPEEAEAWS